MKANAGWAAALPLQQGPRGTRHVGQCAGALLGWAHSAPPLRLGGPPHRRCCMFARALLSRAQRICSLYPSFLKQLAAAQQRSGARMGRSSSEGAQGGRQQPVGVASGSPLLTVCSQPLPLLLTSAAAAAAAAAARLPQTATRRGSTSGTRRKRRRRRRRRRSTRWGCLGRCISVRAWPGRRRSAHVPPHHTLPSARPPCPCCAAQEAQARQQGQGARQGAGAAAEGGQEVSEAEWVPPLACVRPRRAS